MLSKLSPRGRVRTVAGVGFTIALVATTASPAFAAPDTDVTLDDAYTDLARYEPGNPVQVTVVLSDDDGWTGDVHFTLSHLGEVVQSGTVQTTVPAAGQSEATWTVTPPATDFTGYLVEIEAGPNHTTTAIDVSSDWTRFPRMGYLHDYSASLDADDQAAVIDELSKKYHLNALQYYDWMWRHEKPIERDVDGNLVGTWTAWNGDVIAPETVQGYIDAGHDENVAALPYTMSYAALEGFQAHGVDPSWRLKYAENGEDWKFQMIQDDPATVLWLMNPANADWADHITGEYADQVDTFEFDGTHLDQLGNWGKNAPGGEVDGGMTDVDGNRVNLPQAFANLVASTKTATGDKAVGFNAVDGFGGEALAASASDYLYSELWEDHETYAQVQEYLDTQRTDSGGKPAVLAAYLNNGSNTGERYEAEDAALEGGTATNDNHPGFTGTGFVDSFGQPGDSVTFTVTVPESRRYGLVPRYTNGTPTVATRTVAVDGTDVGSWTMQSTDGWEDWRTDAGTSAYLEAGTHTVTVSYEDGDAGYINLDSLTLGTFDTPSVQLANAAFAANGATHIELGQDNQMLAAPYFLDHSKQMSLELEEWMGTYYDVITAYENILYGPDLESVDQAAQPVEIAGINTSTNGAADTVWTNVMRNGDIDVVHLINLIDNNDTWRDGPKNPIPAQSDLSVKYYLSDGLTPGSVKLASPDHDSGASVSVPFTAGTDSGGDFVTFTVPSLHAWSFVYIEPEA